MKTPELKKCPFCAGEAEIIYKYRDIEGAGTVTLVRVRCRECFAQSPYRRSPQLHGWFREMERAVDAWNRRASDENA